jgi:hypothetical protein
MRLGVLGLGFLDEEEGAPQPWKGGVSLAPLPEDEAGRLGLRAWALPFEQFPHVLALPPAAEAAPLVSEGPRPFSSAPLLAHPLGQVQMCSDKPAAKEHLLLLAPCLLQFLQVWQGKTRQAEFEPRL